MSDDFSRELEEIAKFFPNSPQGLSELRALIASLPAPSPLTLPGVQETGLPTANDQAAEIAAGTIPGGSIIPGTIGGDQLADGAVGAAQLDPALDFSGPVTIVDYVPALPDAAFPIGSLISYTPDGKLYRNVGNVWTAAVAVSDIAGQIVGTQIQDGAIYTAHMYANEINGDRIMANTLAANKIIANSITASQIATGAITADMITAGTMSADRIYGGSITGSSIYSAWNIEGYYFIADQGFYYRWPTPDGNGFYTSAFYGVRHGANYNSMYFDDPVQCYRGVAGAYRAGSGNDSWAGGFAFNGLMGVSSDDGANLWFRKGGGWYYIAKTGGFEVPVHETICPVCEQPLLPGENMIGRGDRLRPNGALHALYIHLDCAKDPMVQSIADDYNIDDHPDFDDEPALRPAHEAKVAQMNKKARIAHGLLATEVGPPDFERPRADLSGSRDVRQADMTKREPKP
jgi:hypothetical protein